MTSVDPWTVEVLLDKYIMAGGDAGFVNMLVGVLNMKELFVGEHGIHQRSD
ncbi:hypothetical protein [Roseateles albus]|uniref:Uncharacterized protein n=1 Tax=Roseateles albus TaxID=2987525 RepID=A0ABT5KDT5_9BURK|nr:hypothetical protein [Roseateles albus]MDC8772083.1 hypothetical protein [Roseateles albus]